MKCIICNDDCDKYDGKPWILLDNKEYFENKPSVVGYCSYLCHHRNTHYLPKGYWKNVLNKEDFDFPFPILPNKNQGSFEYLTYSEYIKLTDNEKIDYESQKEIYQFLNPESSQFYNEQYEEDKRTHELENIHIDNSDSNTDDY